ncbi:hypothetical protein [Streptomyces sp. NBC_00236]|uniref:hypothetical protein n=1 Tax=Streptomyces sp. NBC_00236 TaxID=2903639 RepID=UPI002E27F6FB|nr:hypothetical protein [Streptomyces sp. NBC_00236]
MPMYSFTADVADTLSPGGTTNARGTLSAPSPEAARKTVMTSLRSRGYEPTGDVTVTPK